MTLFVEKAPFAERSKSKEPTQDRLLVTVYLGEVLRLTTMIWIEVSTSTSLRISQGNLARHRWRMDTTAHLLHRADTVHSVCRFRTRYRLLGVPAGIFRREVHQESFLREAIACLHRVIEMGLLLQGWHGLLDSSTTVLGRHRCLRTRTCIRWIRLLRFVRQIADLCYHLA